MNRFLDMCRKSAGKAGVLFVALALIVVAVRWLPGFDEQALADYIRSKGSFGIVLYILITAAASAAGVPRQGLSFVAGYAFGAAFGVLFATLGTTLGCACSFFITRRIGKPFLPKRFAGRMERLDAFIASSPFSMTLTVRCLPFGNNALTNVLAGMSSIPAFGFIAGSFVGYIPQNFIFALLGSGMRVDPFWRILIAGGLFVAAFGLGIFLFRRHKAELAGYSKAAEGGEAPPPSEGGDR